MERVVNSELEMVGMNGSKYVVGLGAGWWKTVTKWSGSRSRMQ